MREGGREHYHTVDSTELGSQFGLGEEGSIVMMGGASDTYDTQGGPGLGPGIGLDSDYSGGGVNESSRVVSVVSKNPNPPKSSSSTSKTLPRGSPKNTRRKSFGNDAKKRPASYAYNNKNSPLFDNHR